MTKSLELQLEPPYEIGFNWHASRPVNPNSDWVDIKVTDARERVYNGVVTTLEFIRGNMEKNRATGENENGVYFPVQSVVIVRSIDEGCLRNTIDDLLRKREFEVYFPAE